MNSNTNWLGTRVNGPNPLNSTLNSPNVFGVPSSTVSIPTVSVVDPDPPSQPTQPSQPPQPPSPPQTPISLLPVTLQGPPPVNEPGYVPYYLTQNIGKNIRAEFIIGTNQFVDKVGKLIEVGNNYFVLEDVNSRTHIMCDLYSVRFVTTIEDSTMSIA